ncbi:MAG: phosphatidate cytidylyltransferase [Bacteroidetes bacterium]|nr:phosphatidate cytidylyltransferase [Bacteroidota bacterium]
MNDFLTRTLSGSLFVLLVVGSIILSPYTFLVVFAAFAMMSVREFHKLTNKAGEVEVSIPLSMVASALLFASSFLHASKLIHYPVFEVYGLFVIIVLVSELFRKKANSIHNWAYFILGQILIALPFALLSFIGHIDHVMYKPLILIAVFVTIWVNDTGAYLFGITFGKHRLFERISPKKSWEGFFGGALAALASGYVFSLFIPELSLFEWFLFSEIIVISGTFGDLIESLLKRTLHVKDSGNAIPGHGGFLDRFDSMLLAAPVIFIYLSFIFLIYK